MTSWSSSEQKAAASSADDIVRDAIRFANKEDVENTDVYCTLIAQHVKVQVAYLSSPDESGLDARSRVAAALEKLANAADLHHLDVSVTHDNELEISVQNSTSEELDVNVHHMSG